MKVLCFLAVTLTSFLVVAQESYTKKEAPTFTVSGAVLDFDDENGLPFAALSFLNAEDKSLVTGGICDNLGNFSIENVKGSTYTLLIEYIGYEPMFINDVKVRRPKNSQMDRSKSANLTVDIGAYKIKKSINQLDEVELVEEKAMIVQEIDRKIFNVGQDITNTGGSAIELMEKLPSVEVDIDGNISLRGSNQVRLFVDGKPSMLTSSELLETLPSSMIESIELITNPSAKYSPEGMAGIINVVLKKNDKAGFNGTVTATVGYPTRNNFTTLLNRRTKKLNIFGSYGYMDRSSWFKSESESFNYPDSTTTNYLFQEKSGIQERNSHTFKGGIDFTPNESSSYSLQGNFSPSTRSKMDTINYTEIDSTVPNRFDRLNSSDTEQESWTIDFNGKKDWESGVHLDFSVNQSRNTKNNYGLFTETLLDNNDPGFGVYPLIEQLSSDRNDGQFEAKIDFTYGAKETGKVEWGLSTRTRDIDQNLFTELDSTTNGWVDNSNLENQFIFEDVVYSAYAIYAKSFGVIGMQAGLRAEDVYTSSNLVNDTSTYNNDYFKLYPSFYLTYQLDESTSLQASYSRRVNRPGFYQLNPFPEYSDPFNLRMGNPYLNPEFINSYELGYSKYAKGTTLSASVYAKDLNNMQRRFIEVDSTNVSTVTYRNLNGSFDVGIEFMWSKQVSETFNFMISSNLFHSQMDASNLTNEFDESTFGMRANFNMAYKKNGQKLQLSGWIRPGNSVGQGRMETMLSSDLAYSRPVLSNKGRLTLKISDLFNTRRFGIDTSGANFDKSFWYKRQSQAINLSLSYNFGDQSNNKQRRGGYRDSGGDMDGGFF